MSKIESLDRLYNLITKFFTHKDLCLSKKTSESVKFDKRDISKAGLDKQDIIKCIHDIKRTRFFLEEIRKNVKKQYHVLEIGIGTGIFSFASALLGAKVEGYEINEENLNIANTLRKQISDEKPEWRSSLYKNCAFHLKDGTKTRRVKNKFDIVISENIYTGMFYEKQVQIMNSQIKNLNKTGVVIPSAMRSYLSLGEVYKKNDRAFGITVVNELPNMSKAFKQLSRMHTYDYLDFTKRNKQVLKQKLKITASRSGEINSLLIKSNVYMPSGKIIHGFQTNFFNNDIILHIPAHSRVSIKKGETVELTIVYKYGSKPSEILFSIKK